MAFKVLMREYVKGKSNLGRNRLLVKRKGLESTDSKIARDFLHCVFLEIMDILCYVCIYNNYAATACSCLAALRLFLHNDVDVNNNLVVAVNCDCCVFPTRWV